MIRTAHCGATLVTDPELLETIPLGGCGLNDYWNVINLNSTEGSALFADLSFV